MLYDESRKYELLNEDSDDDQDSDDEDENDESDSTENEYDDDDFNDTDSSDYSSDLHELNKSKHVNLDASWVSGNFSNRNSLSKERSRSQIDNSSKDIDQGLSLTETKSSSGDDPDDEEDENYFFHIAYTPTEVTIICSTRRMATSFAEPLDVCKRLQYNDVELIDQTFLNLQIDSDGSYSNNLRILELTRPLSENGISLFFISSHFSDIVLIPFELKEKVISILTKQNFKFSDISNSYIVTKSMDEEIPIPLQFEDASKNLETNTFDLFKKSNIKPKINSKVKLLLTGSRSGEIINTILKSAQIISSNKVTDYFAITRTSMNEVSLILPKSAKKRSQMGFNSSNIIGSDQDIIVPISIDLTKLPLDSTGIVAGLASKIINGYKKFPQELQTTFEMNYLSMARSAILMIPQENLHLVSKILKSVDYNQAHDEIQLAAKLDSIQV